MSEESTATETPADNTEQTATETAPILSQETEESTEATETVDTQTPVLGQQPETQETATEESETETVEEKEPEEKPEENEPVEYTEFTLPEGFEMDKGLQDAVMPMFAKNGISQEDAQSIVDSFSELQKVRATEAQENTKKAIEGWQKELTDDPKYKENLALAQKGVARLGKEIPQAQELFNDPTLGHMPVLFKIAEFIGRTMESEATLLASSTQGDNGGSFLNKMFPSMK